MVAGNILKLRIRDPKIYRVAEYYTRFLKFCLLCQMAFGPHSIIINGLVLIFPPEIFKVLACFHFDAGRLACIPTSGVGLVHDG
jgi:hypothetical protein